MKKPMSIGSTFAMALFLASGPSGAADAEPAAGEDEGEGQASAGDEESGAPSGSAEETDPVEPEKAKKAKEVPSKASLLLPVSEIGAVVLLDGEELGVTPLASISGLTVGTHDLTVKKDGFFTYSAEVDIPADGSVRHDVLLASGANKDVVVPPLLRKWWFWTIVGSVVVAGAGVGIYFGARPAEPDGVPMPPF